MEEVEAEQPRRLLPPLRQPQPAQRAVGVIVGVLGAPYSNSKPSERLGAYLEPCEVGLDDAGGVGADDAVLADVDAVLEAEQVRHLDPGA